MNGILINPYYKMIRDTYCDNTLNDIGFVLDCDSPGCILELNNGDALYADVYEDNQIPQFMLFGKRVYGRAIIIRVSPKGNALTSVEDVKKAVQWL